MPSSVATTPRRSASGCCAPRLGGAGRRGSRAGLGGEERLVFFSNNGDGGLGRAGSNEANLFLTKEARKDMVWKSFALSHSGLA